MSRPKETCYHCGGDHPSYGFVVALDAEGQPVHALFCSACQEAGWRHHRSTLGQAEPTPATAPAAQAFDKPPPQQDGQGRLF